MKSLLVVIPARAGSKGLKNKNRKRILGKSLFMYAIEIAFEIKFALADTSNVIIVPATDDAALQKEAKNLSIFNYKRPQNLSGDEATVIDLILDITKTFKFSDEDLEYVLILQPTSPQRTLTGFFKIWQEMAKNKVSTIASVSPLNLRPSEILIGNSNYLTSLETRIPDTRRQDESKEIFFEDGAYYLCRYSDLKKQKSTQPEPRSYVIAHDFPVIDIDSASDFACAKSIMETNYKEVI